MSGNGTSTAAVTPVTTAMDVLPDGPSRVILTELQQSLVQAGVHDPESSAMLAALIQRGPIEARIIQVETPHSPARQCQVRLTRAGRRAVPKPTLNGLPGWLEDALTAVRDTSPQDCPIPQ